MGKIKTVVIFAAGYVVGAKAGHQRYEQIKNWAQEMWGKPAVQEQVDNATEQAGKLAQEAKERLPGFKSNDKDSTDQNSTGSEKDSHGKDSGQA